MASNRSMPPRSSRDVTFKEVVDMCVSLYDKKLPIVKIMTTPHGASTYARFALETYPDARVSMERDGENRYKVTIDKK